MDDKNMIHKNQDVSIANRQSVTLSGVKDVGTFTEEQVHVSTVKGGLILKGNELKIRKLDLDDGKVIIDGMINSLTYTDKGEKKDKNILGKIFR